MIASHSNSKKDNIVPYICKFQLYVAQVEAQVYFPSWYQICWKTKDNDILFQTEYMQKNQLNIVRFDQTLEAQTIMLYKTETKTYIDKDTFICINYYLNTKKDEVKELGKLPLKMVRFMEDNGKETLRKGESKEETDLKGSVGISRKNPMSRNQNRMVQDTKCLRLQGTQYNAKIRFKCKLVQSSLSKLPLSSIAPEQFNEPFQLDIRDRSKTQEEEKHKASMTSGNAVKVTMNGQQDRIQQMNRNKKKEQGGVQQEGNRNKSTVQREKSNKESQEKIQQILPEGLMISKGPLESAQRTMNEQKLCSQLQELQRQNMELKQVVEKQKNLIKEQEELLKRIKADYLELEQEFKEKEVYFEGNLEKLERVDHLRYELIEVKEYASKLEERLVQIYREKPQTLRALFKTISVLATNNGSSRESILIGTGRTNNFNKESRQQSTLRNSHNFQEQSSVRISSITLIDEKDQNCEKKPLSESVSHLRVSQPIPETKTSVPLDNLYNISNSELQLSSSEVRQLQGSTVRMQKELSFMQMELYEVKENINMQQEMYETEVKNHQETKLELFDLEEKFRAISNDCQIFQRENKDLTIENSELKRIVQNLEEQDRELKQQLQRVQMQMGQLKRDLFKTSESKQEQEYHLSLSIKHQSIQIQTLQSQLKANALELQKMQQLRRKIQTDLETRTEELSKMKQELDCILQVRSKMEKEMEGLRNKELKINDYLSSLEKQIQEVYEIVEEKQNNEHDLGQQLQAKQDHIQKLQLQIQQLQAIVRNLQLSLQTTENQLALQRVKASPHKQTCTSKQSSSPSQKQLSREKQRQHKISQLQSQHKELLSKNKQLIAIVNRNATALIMYERQKKEYEKLSQLTKQMNEFKRESQKVRDENKVLQQQNIKLKSASEELEKKYLSQIKALQQSNESLELKLKQSLQKNSHLFQESLKQKSSLSSLESRLHQREKYHAQSQIKIQKLAKEKKMLEQAQKMLQTKNRNYQSLLMQQQSTIQTNQSLIKDLENKIKSYETYQLGANSLRNSSYGNTDKLEGMSEIKLESQIQDSHRTISLSQQNVSSSQKGLMQNINSSQQGTSTPQMSLAKNHIKPSQSIKPSEFSKSSEEPSLIQSLMSEIQFLKQKLQNCKASEFQSKQKEVSKKNESLIHMIESYLRQKNSEKDKNQMAQVLQKLTSSKIIHASQMEQAQISTIVKKAQQVSMEISKFKTKLVSENRLKTKNPISSSLSSLKPIQNLITELIELTQNIDKSPSKLKV